MNDESADICNWRSYGNYRDVSHISHSVWSWIF